MIASIVLGSGCFWGAQHILRLVPGVIRTEVGYCGGDLLQPAYKQVKTGTTGHAEVVKVEYDTSKTSLSKVLDVFFSLHDPTTEDRQGNDIGSQYRSVIFYQSPEEKNVIAEKIQQVGQAGFWKNSIVTTLEPLKNYYRAEEYHQDYLLKNPTGYTCHFMRYPVEGLQV